VANKNSVLREEYRREDQYLSIEIQPEVSIFFLFFSTSSVLWQRAVLRFIVLSVAIRNLIAGANPIAGQNAALFWDGLEWLEREFSISGKGLVTFLSRGVAAAIAGPNAALFWDGVERLRDKLTSSGLVRIMCDGVASRTSSPEWVDAVLGVLHFTSAACVRALVHHLPTVAMVGAMHARLQPRYSSEHRRFEREVCVGSFQRKRERVCKWLSDDWCG